MNRDTAWPGGFLRIVCVAIVCPAALQCSTSGSGGDFPGDSGDEGASGDSASGDGSGSQDASMGSADSQSAAPDAGTTMMDSTAPPPPTEAGGDDGTTGTPDAAPPPNDGGMQGEASTTAPCKRGVAGAVSQALARTATAPGVAWYYNWSSGGSSTGTIDFVPMVWGASNLGDSVPSGSKYLLGFNEPNFMAQANLTPQEAASDWPQVEAIAKAAGGIPLVSPAVNFCGGCTDPSITDPYTYLSDFLAACTGCKVDYIAVHWYNCDLPSLQGYIEGNGSLQGFVQFGKPIWLTEFSCDGTASVDQQKAYMQAAIPWLESNPHVYRYSWFSADPIPNAVLVNPDGTLTDLGNTYVSLPANCQ